MRVEFSLCKQLTIAPFRKESLDYGLTRPLPLNILPASIVGLSVRIWVKTSNKIKSHFPSLAIMQAMLQVIVAF